MAKENVKRQESCGVGDGDLTVVGIGCSAGGLQACRDLLKHLPGNDVAYVLCQHLSPNHQSMLTDILSRDTDLTVIQITQGMPLSENHLYVTPPNSDVRIEDNQFNLSVPPESTLPKPNINAFYDSLAEAKGEKAVALILSGSGSDGSLGVTRIKSVGGTVLVQEPRSSQYDGMPKSAIATQVVDYVGSIKGVALKLDQLLKIGQLAFTAEEETDIYQEIMRYISAQTNIDFAHYKRTTMSRRLARRMSIKGKDSIESYLSLLRDDSAEVLSFVQDAFIVVSEFYRDPYAFDALKAQLIDTLSVHPKEQEFRVWVPGCAAGEEAYTIAMLIQDIARETREEIGFKILATDVSDKAVSKARVGVYDLDSLTNIPARWTEDYFRQVGSQFQVIKSISDRIVFSVHNLLADPPFSRLNLISCRNLLIYFEERLQHDIVNVFHYSLSSDGLMFLGASEAVKEKDLFDPCNSKAQIYRKKNHKSTKPSIPPFILRRHNDPGLPVTRAHKQIDIVETNIYKALAKTFAPPLMILNGDNVMIFGQGNYRAILTETHGIINNDFFESVIPALRAEYRALLYKSKRTMEEESGGLHEVYLGDELSCIRLFVRPLGADFQGWSCLSYSVVERNAREEVNRSQEALDEEDKSHLLELEHELTATRENLQTVVEELETANEQLQVYNEELQSSNEEYQSTNEELQTVNEELQSTNEELLTVNDEYALKTLEQSRLSSDLSNIQESIELPLFLVSTEYRIKRFTRSCNRIVDITKIKLDDIIFAIHWYSEIPNLKPLIDSVSAQNAPLKHEMLIDNRNYQCQVSPYVNSDGKLDGYTIIFYDTTDFQRAQADLSTQKAIAQVTLETIMEGVIRVDSNLCIDYINSAAVGMMEWGSDDVVGYDIGRRFKVFDEEGEIMIEELVRRCVEDQKEHHDEGVPFLLKTKFGKQVTIELSISPMARVENVAGGAVIAFRDVTERQSQLKTLMWRSKHDPLTGLVNRHEMEKRIDQSILAAKRDHINSSLLYLDLDQFKVINDTCGHLAGDQLLKQLAQLMTEMLRSRDTLARLGGDEFALLLDKCPIAEAESIAIKIQKSISDYRYAWEDKVFRVGVSIGIVSIQEDVNQVAQVLSDADAACYAAKESGRNSIQVHSHDNAILETQRLQMRSISDINEAIEQGNFRLYFQEIRPIIGRAKGRWEVLLRMFNHNGEFLLPNCFLPAAERFGLISRIDFWVLENTLAKLNAFLHNGNRNFPNLSINISAHTLGDEIFIEKLKGLIAAYNIDPRCLSFEVTETATISNYVKARSFMGKVRELGCGFSLDDFGTGMSSLSYLRDLPIDTVKVDASFIENITNDKVKSAIVRSVNEVAHLLSLNVVGEGVEDEQQYAHLKDLGVDCIQGFYLNKPMPFEEFVASVVSQEA